MDLAPNLSESLQGKEEEKNEPSSWITPPTWPLLVFFCAKEIMADCCRERARMLRFYAAGLVAAPAANEGQTNNGKRRKLDHPPTSSASDNQNKVPNTFAKANCNVITSFSRHILLCAQLPRILAHGCPYKACLRSHTRRFPLLRNLTLVIPQRQKKLMAQ